MNKFTKPLLVLITLSSMTSLSGCSWWKSSTANNSEANVHLTEYALAKPTKEIEIPKYIASNIKRQPIYPVNMNSKLSGKINANKVPPTLTDKLVDND